MEEVFLHFKVSGGLVCYVIPSKKKTVVLHCGKVTVKGFYRVCDSKVALTCCKPYVLTVDHVYPFFSVSLLL